jgi:hypothetical protein
MGRPKFVQAINGGAAPTAAPVTDPRFMQLNRGDKIICEVMCKPNARGLAKGRKPYRAFRVVDRRIWAKLDDRARGQWIDRIRAEVGA